jgi:hypothetical protein
MSKSAKSSKGVGLAIRLGIIILVGAGLVVAVQSMRSPLSITESEVRRMVSAHELNGLTLAEAAAKLQQRAPTLDSGRLEVDFANVPGWSAGTLMLEVLNGKVIAAAWWDQVQNDEGSGAR